MQRTQHIMGMPITITTVDDDPQAVAEAFDCFRAADRAYSPFKPDSEVSRVRAGLSRSRWSKELQGIVKLCEQTTQQTNGYFDVGTGKQFDPSGLVKGWAIQRAAERLARRVDNFYIEAGGDIQSRGHNAGGKPWRFGIRNPFNRHEIIKTVTVQGQGVATSGTYLRGQHIYNPHRPGKPVTDIISLTVIGPNIYEADRFATAAFAMGREGIRFIDQLAGFAGYMIDSAGIATMSRSFAEFVP